MQCVFIFPLEQTAVAIGAEVADKLPDSEYSGYFAPVYTLHRPTSNMKNANSSAELENIKQKVFDILSKLPHAPSVQFHEWRPDTELVEVLSSLNFTMNFTNFHVNRS